MLLPYAIQETNMRVDAHDDFAVKFQHESQAPVRRGMLRPKIDREIAGARLRPCRPHVTAVAAGETPHNFITALVPGVRVGTKGISAARNQVEGTIAVGSKFSEKKEFSPSKPIPANTTALVQGPGRQHISLAMRLNKHIRDAL
jgi:hypothetical protein